MKKITSIGLFISLGFLLSFDINAQESNRSVSLIENVITTARKKEESVQDVPISITALDSNQIEVLKIANLGDLSVGLPNIELDDVGTSPGYANFSMRGLGINSSIPSVDPAVGVIVDGVYMGINTGVVLDIFDIESIQFLRGPQGTLFGKNVTGGAVLINRSKPTDEMVSKAKLTLEGGGDGGLKKILQYATGGPISENLKAKISLYASEDDGYFKNSFDNSDAGGGDYTGIRPIIVFTPNENVDSTLVIERTEGRGDGAVAQCHTAFNGTNCDTAPYGNPNIPSTFDRDTHDFSNDNKGYANSDNDFISLTTNINTDNGTWTHVLGITDYTGWSLGDIDARSISFFDGSSQFTSEQMSNEFRYVGDLSETLSITAGYYFYENDIKYQERREIARALYGAPQTWDGGGFHETESSAVFVSFDKQVSEILQVTFGARWTDEEKTVDLVSMSRNIVNPGVAPNCEPWFGLGTTTCPFDYEDTDSWKSFSPKLSAMYLLDERSRLYASWSKGFRSGGYNLRNTSTNPSDSPKFDQEEVSTFEIGYKSEMDNGRFNVSIFNTGVDDMQRELNFAGAAGVVQLIRNTAEASIRGFEMDTAIMLDDTTFLNASIGYVDAKLDSVMHDLNNDGSIDGADLSLEIPRAAPLSYSIGISKDHKVGGWDASTRLTFAHRDRSYYLDSNKGWVNEQDRINLGIDVYSPDGKMNIGLFGKNLKDEVVHGNDTQLSFMGTFAPLLKGRIIGVQVIYNY